MINIIEDYNKAHMASYKSIEQMIPFAEENKLKK